MPLGRKVESSSKVIEKNITHIQYAFMTFVHVYIFLFDLKK